MEFVQILLLAARVAASIVGYARGFRMVYVLNEGKVRVGRYTRLDALIGGLLVLFLIAICFSAFGSKQTIDPRRVDTFRLIFAVLGQWGVIIGTLIVLFVLRGIPPTTLFGLDQMKIRKVVGLAICLLLVALPLVFATNVVVS